MSYKIVFSVANIQYDILYCNYLSDKIHKSSQKSKKEINKLVLLNYFVII